MAGAMPGNIHRLQRKNQRLSEVSETTYQAPD